jgi:serine/threonine-protein kinase
MSTHFSCSQGRSPNSDEADPRIDDIPPFREAALPDSVLQSWCNPTLAPEALGRDWSPDIAGFEILRELGRGGMGVVFLARQTRLNRLVALKVILPGAQAGEEVRARFEAEAEAAAQLHHPNIVQVFEFGEDSGTLYLALEFVDGQPLGRAMEGRPQPPREAAELALKLARAVAFAHLRGIVHRDLKPANVLLSSTGEPKIADFGLARNLGRESDKTLTGTVLGTPNYMSPEQAAGKVKTAGPAADIYGLGAILYWLLAGRPPFHADSVMEVLRQVIEHEPPSVRLLNPTVARDLETICHKCLQKDQQRRYRTASDLADDLERFLRGEPIAARPVGAVERFARWCRRNPRVAALSAAVVTIFLAGFAAVAWQWRETVHHRRQAEQNLEWASSAVNDLFTSVSETRLLDEKGLQPLRRELLQEALAYYELFTRERSGNPALEQRLAEAHFNIGKIHGVLGDSRRAVAALQNAATMHERLAAAQKDSIELAWNLARCYGQLAEQEEVVGDLEHAARHYDLACNLLSDLASRPTRNFQIELDLADYLADRAFLRARSEGNYSEVVAPFQQAIAAHEAIVAARPEDDRVLRQLAALLNNLGVVQSRLGGQDAALAAHQHGLQIQLQLLRESPESLELQQSAADSHFNLGRIFTTLGRNEDALASFTESGAIYGRLCEDNPQVPRYQQGHADCLTETATIHAQEREFEKAGETLLEAAAILAQLAEAAPDSLSLQQSLRSTYQSLASCLREQNDLEGSLAYLEKAALVQSEIAAKNPGLPEAIDAQADQFNNLGVAYRDAGKLNEALRMFDKALGLKMSLGEAFLSAADRQSAIARIHVNSARCRVLMGNVAEAGQAYRAAETIWQPLVEKEPARWPDRDALAMAMAELGDLQLVAGDHDAARTSYRSAVGQLTSLVEDSGDDAYRFDLAFTLHNNGLLEAELGDLAAARDYLSRAEGLFSQIARQRPDEFLYVSSLIQTQCGLGELARGMGDAPAAEAWYAAAAAHAGKLVETSGESASASALLEQALLGHANSLRALGRSEEAAQAQKRAAEVAQNVQGRPSSDAALNLDGRPPGP